jgi:hypothetical protein
MVRTAVDFEKQTSQADISGFGRTVDTSQRDAANEFNSFILSS